VGLNGATRAGTKNPQDARDDAFLRNRRINAPVGVNLCARVVPGNNAGNDWEHHSWRYNSRLALCVPYARWNDDRLSYINGAEARRKRARSRQGFLENPGNAITTVDVIINNCA